METDWQIDAARHTVASVRSIMLVKGIEDTDYTGDRHSSLSHFEFMLQEIEKPMSSAKRGRWLGWMQAAAVSRFYPEMKLKECKEINRACSERFEKEKSLLVIKSQLQEKIDELSSLVEDAKAKGAEVSFDIFTVGAISGDIQKLNFKLWKDI